MTAMEELIVVIRTHRPGDLVTLDYARGSTASRPMSPWRQGGLSVAPMFDINAPEFVLLLVIA